MRTFQRWLVVVFATIAVLSFAKTASAQAARTWVSGVGVDINPCTRTAPCKTFAAAFAKTPAGGEIDVLDDGAYGVVEITRSVTIDGRGKIASIFNGTANGILVRAGASDVVSIRGLSINGGGNGLSGIKVESARRVVIDDSVVFGSAVGIEVSAAASMTLAVQNTTVRNNNAAGLRVASSAGTATAFVDNSSFVNNFSGVSVRQNANVIVRRSSFFAHDANGIIMEAATSGALVSSCLLSGNLIGVHIAAAGATVRVGDSDIVANSTGLSNGSGQLLSFGDNRIAGNSTDGAFSGTVGGLK